MYMCDKICICVCGSVGRSVRVRVCVCVCVYTSARGASRKVKFSNMVYYMYMCVSQSVSRWLVGMRVCVYLWGGYGQ